jgi:glycosyltransferase involved in cell wall biosynthesis
MNENLLLTIFVPTHNSERFLKKTLESILNQNYPNFKVVVSDNASTDRTVEIVKSFQDPKLFFRENILSIKSDKDYIGCYDNYNGCLRSGLAEGEFVAFYHSDDIYEKDMVRKEVEFLMANPEAGAVFTLGTLIDENDKMIGKFKLPNELKRKNIYNFMEIFKALLKNGNIFLQTPTFMARKNIFEKIGLFNEEDFGTSADLEMWLRILEKHPIGILNEKLIRWRVRWGGKRYQYLCTERADFFKVMDYFLESKSFAPRLEKKFLRQYEYQKSFNDTLRAMNFLIKNEVGKAKALINKKPSFDLLRAFFEGLNIRKIKGAILRIVLIIGINLKLGKYLSKILYRLRYS